VGDLGDLLELLHGARNRYRTVRATVRERFDHDLGRQAWTRYHGDDEEERWDDDEPLTGTSEHVMKVWFEPPDRIREERPSTSHGWRLAIQNGRRWWAYDPNGTVYSNEDEPEVGTDVAEAAMVLFDPAPLIGALWLEPREHLEVAGRRALGVRAKLRRGSHHAPISFRLDLDVDEHQLAVDVERGIVLRKVALLDEAPVSTLEILEIAFDETFEPAMFEPVPGTRATPPVAARELALEDLPRAAPFRVFVPRGLAPGWVVGASYFPGDPREHFPEMVMLELTREDGSRRASIMQTKSGDPYLEEEWQQCERVHRFDREGTHVQLSSPNMSEAELAELADALE
jgi:hypothetical protein